MNTMMYKFYNLYGNPEDILRNWKEKIQKEYNETIKLPRKLKKKRRKELQLDWNIANWE